MRNWRPIFFTAVFGCMIAQSALLAQQPAASELKIDWSKTVIESKATPTLQVVVNPQVIRGSKLHDGTFAALKMLGADYVRYVPWLPYPRQAVAELEPPTKEKTLTLKASTCGRRASTIRRSPN